MGQSRPFYRQPGRLLKLGLLAAFAVGLWRLWGAVFPGCPYDKFYDSPHLRIAETPWVVDFWGQGCGFGISGGMEIRALNEESQETVTILHLPKIISDIAAGSDEPRSLIITLPNRVVIGIAAAYFDEVKVSYKFSPYDDPEDRAEFQKWYHHRYDPQSRHWWCETIQARMSSAGAEMDNQVLTQGAEGRLATGESYCPAR